MEYNNGVIAYGDMSNISSKINYQILPNDDEDLSFLEIA